MSDELDRIEGQRALPPKSLPADGEEHIQLNPNVLIEIGAAMALYGPNYILLVEGGAKLPSNVQGLNEVRYEGTTLDADATMRPCARSTSSRSRSVERSGSDHGARPSSLFAYVSRMPRTRGRAVRSRAISVNRRTNRLRRVECGYSGRRGVNRKSRGSRRLGPATLGERYWAKSLQKP
jgi:CAP12/Pycsar effector protein, TIR domain